MEENSITRRDFFKQLGAIALAASPIVTSLSSLTSCSVGKTREPRLTILHTNDVHSHIDPFPDSDTNYAGQGGYARRQTFIDKVREAEGGDNVMVLEAGDMFQGTPYFNFFHGQLEMQLMNRMHIDAVTIGNHEYDNGLESLYDCMNTANFPFLSANYIFTDPRGAKIVKPYKVFDRGGIRIGVFGLGIRLAGLVAPMNCPNVEFREIIPTAQAVVNTLRQQEKCQLVIALTHIGLKDVEVGDIMLAKNTTGIDIILGGHTHTFLSQPELVPDQSGKIVVINQVGYGGINVGKLQVASVNSMQLSLLDSQSVNMV